MPILDWPELPGGTSYYGCNYGHYTGAGGGEFVWVSFIDGNMVICRDDGGCTDTL